MSNIYRNLRYDLPLHFVLILTNWLPDNVIFIRLRGYLASPFFKKSGKGLKIGRNVTFYNCSQISFGNNVYVAKGAWFSGSNGIEIGNNIIFGPYVVIVTSNHSLQNGAYCFGPPVKTGKVIIKDGCWIGAHCSILSKCILETCTLLAANSVLNQSTSANGIYAGLPAKLLKTIK